jgi:large subunit ribosomal protein L17
MHRHGYQGRKFHRERDQRKALIKSLAESLVKYETIETTLPKAKAVVPYVERLITKAKKGDLHNRRLIISDLQTIATAHKLVDEIAPKLATRTSGHLRIERTTFRRGDHAELARVSFVDDLTAEVAKKKEPVAEEAVKAETPVAKKTAAKAKPATAKKPAAKKEAKK